MAPAGVDIGLGERNLGDGENAPEEAGEKFPDPPGPGLELAEVFPVLGGVLIRL